MAVPSVAGGDVRRHGVREAGQRECLQVDLSRSAELGQEDGLGAEEHVLDALDTGDCHVDSRLKESDVSRVDENGLTGTKFVRDGFTGQLDPRGSLTPDVLHEEAITGEDAHPEALLEGNFEVDVGGGREKAVARHHVFAVRVHRDGANVTGHFGREGDLGRGVVGSELGHEDGTSGEGALEHAAQAGRSRARGLGRHFDVGVQPRHLTTLRDDTLTGLESYFESGHQTAQNAMGDAGVVGVREFGKCTVNGLVHAQCLSQGR